MLLQWLAHEPRPQMPRAGAGYDSSALAYQLPDGTDVVVGPRDGQYRRTVRSQFALPPVGTRLLHWSTGSF